MCRMFAAATKRRIEPSLLEDFRRLATQATPWGELPERHEDGWGIAGYLGNWTMHFGRSDKSAEKDAGNFRAAAHKALHSGSKILLCHLRQASEGIMSVENTHPFIHNDWIFCHNGTVHESEKLLLPDCRYEGTTDSERLFKYIVDRLHRRSRKNWPALIRQAVSEIRGKCRYTSLSFLLADRGHLVAYRDCSEEAARYSLHVATVVDGVLFCSEKLPGAHWRLLEDRELVIVDNNGGVYHEL